MRPHVRRLAAASAAAYLLAGWLATALHSHGHAHAGPDDAAKEGGACTTCSCGHHHHETAKGHDKEHESPASPGEGCHHCPVCEFLAKPPVAVTAVTLEAALEPIVDAAEPLVPTFEPVSQFVSRSRGPPVA